MSGGLIAAVIIGLLVIAGASASIRGMTRQSRSADRVLGMPVGQPEAAYLGGLLCSTVQATWPLARLELLDWGVRVASSARVLKFLPLSVPTWEARYDELGTVRHVSGPQGTGLRFALAGGRDALVFWSSRNSEILDRLEAAGVTVDRSVTSLKLAGGG